VVWTCRERLVDVVIRRVDHMEESQITRGRGRLGKTIKETTKKYLEINELEKDIWFLIEHYGVV